MPSLFVFGPDPITLENRLRSLPPESLPSSLIIIRPSEPTDLDGDLWDNPMNRYIATT